MRFIIFAAFAFLAVQVCTANVVQTEQPSSDSQQKEAAVGDPTKPVVGETLPAAASAANISEPTDAPAAPPAEKPTVLPDSNQPAVQTTSV